MSRTHANSNGPAEKKKPSLRVLIIEDSSMDAFLLERALERGGFQPSCHRVDTSEGMIAALDWQEWDIILADHSMPRFSAPEALELAKRKGLDVPFIIVSGHIEEETAVSAMNSGAHDYIMKDRLARLVPAVERELREAAMRRDQKKYEAELRRAHNELESRVEQRTAALQAANQKLHSALEERRRLENELLEIAENERRSIGFDLHDDLGQKLTGVSLMLKGLEQQLGREHHKAHLEVCGIRELIEQAIHHTHNLAHQFSSLDVKGDNLPCVLKELAGNVKNMFRLPCALTIQGDIPPLPRNTTMQLYKIAQEAVSNAIKHGEATEVAISCSSDPNELALTIRNDGVPFSLPEEKKNRMGLRIMNYRASTIGATFDIKPNQKNGTVVTCTLSLKNGNRSQHDQPQKQGSASQGVVDELTTEHAVS